MSREVWLVYNGVRSIKVDRHRVAESCFYLATLLKGNFKESRQHCININIGNMVPFKAFASVVKYANSGEFSRDQREYPMHVAAIQLAILWCYQEFVEIAESYLIDQLSVDTLIDIFPVALRHRNSLSLLLRACDEYAEMMNNRRFPIAWPQCSKDGHRRHHLLSCLLPADESDSDLDW